MIKMLRFSQVTTASGILMGRVKRREVRSCDLCGALVPLSELGLHARFHDARNDLTYYRVDPGQCENNGDRIVTVQGDMTMVAPS